MWVPVQQQSDYVVWSASGGPISVRIASAVIERITVDVMRGFGVTRRRGTEVGGILVGRLDPGPPAAVWIEDYAVVPCEYAFGPSYILSPTDDMRFGRAIDELRPAPGKNSYRVGYFRSHTRAGIHLDTADAELFSRYFGDGINVALIVKPFATRAARASFFLPVNGKLEPAVTADEFQFTTDAAVLEMQEVAGPAPDRPASEAIATAAPVSDPLPPSQAAESATPIPQAKVNEPAPAPEIVEAEPEIVEAAVVNTQDDDPPEHARTPVFQESAWKPSYAERGPVDVLGVPSRGLDSDDRRSLPDSEFLGSHPARRRWSTWKRAMAWAAFTLAAMFFGVVLGYQYGGGRVPPIVLNTVRAPVPVGPPLNPYGTDLSVERQDNNLLVTWNRNAGIVTAAQSGVLTISEADASKQVELGAAELRNGTVLYQNVAPEVTFSLELSLAENRKLTESVTWRSADRALSGR